jgi:hypothetical protein
MSLAGRRDRADGEGRLRGPALLRRRFLLLSNLERHMLTESHRQAVRVRPTLDCLEDRRLLSAAAAVAGNDFLQVNLVANVAGVAANRDPSPGSAVCFRAGEKSRGVSSRA